MVFKQEQLHSKSSSQSPQLFSGTDVPGPPATTTPPSIQVVKPINPKSETNPEESFSTKAETSKLPPSLSSKTGNVKVPVDARSIKQLTVSKEIGKGKISQATTSNMVQTSKSTISTKPASANKPITTKTEPSTKQKLTSKQLGTTTRPTFTPKTTPVSRPTPVSRQGIADTLTPANSSTTPSLVNSISTTGQGETSASAKMAKQKPGFGDLSPNVVSATAAAIAASAAKLKKDSEPKIVTNENENRVKSPNNSTVPISILEANASTGLPKTLRVNSPEKTTNLVGSFISALSLNKDDRRTDNLEVKSTELTSENSRPATPSSTLITNKYSTNTQKLPITKSKLSSAVAAASAFARAKNEQGQAPNDQTIKKKPAAEQLSRAPSLPSSSSLIPVPSTSPISLGPSENGSTSLQTKPVSISRKSTPVSTAIPESISTPKSTVPLSTSSSALKSPVGPDLSRSSNSRSNFAKAGVSNEVPIPKFNTPPISVPSSYSTTSLGKSPGNTISTSPYRGQMVAGSPQPAKHFDLTLRSKHNRVSSQHLGLPSNSNTGLSGGAHAGAMAAALAAKYHAKEVTNKINAEVNASKEKVSRNSSILSKVKAEVGFRNHHPTAKMSPASSSNNRLRIPVSPKRSPRSSFDTITSTNNQKSSFPTESQNDSDDLEAPLNNMHPPANKSVRIPSNMTVRAGESSRLDAMRPSRKPLKTTNSLLPPAELTSPSSDIKKNSSSVNGLNQLNAMKPKAASETQLVDLINKEANATPSSARVSSLNPYKNGNPYNTDTSHNFMSIDINSKARPLSISGYPPSSFSSSTGKLNRTTPTSDLLEDGRINPYTYAQSATENVEAPQRKSLLSGLFNYSFQQPDIDENIEDEEITRIESPLSPRRTTIGEYDPNKPTELHETSKGVISIPESSNKINHNYQEPKKGKRGMMKLLFSGHKHSKNSSSHQVSSENEPRAGSTPRTPIKTTMRKAPRKKSFNVDKPWKHHVDAVILNEAERKRYEGLWAANKGVHLDFMGHEDGLTEDEEYEEDMYDHEEDDSEDTYITNVITEIADTVKNYPKNAIGVEIDHKDCIHGYIVREIWARSRLSDDTLAQIWELVDRVKGGTLDREGFLVGMWLVDQCLYGRKLPTKVDENVWRSVGRMNVHVKIKIYKQKKKQKKAAKIAELDA